MVVQSHCYIFFLFFLSLYTLVSPTLHHCHQEERDALLEFKFEFPNLRYNNASADLSLLSSWNKTSDCCSWKGVTCDNKTSQVISLTLQSIPLNSSLKPNSNLFRLQHLQSLVFYDCNLYGEIPSSLGNFSHLKRLMLRSNSFSGQVPSSLGNLTQLEILILSNNNFNGNIPISFANLTKLSYLTLYNNHFESMLPREMSRLQNLENFDIGGNSFVGSFPTFLFTIPSLVFANLSGNHFEGHIEFTNISSSSRLGHLFLSQNKLDGPIPESLFNFLNLQVVDLSINNFIGQIPKSISKLVKLDFLDVSKNRLEGQVPGCLWGLTAAMLSHNSFDSFEQPDETKLQILDVQSNSLRGTFPYWICNLRSLRLLDLSNNIFHGSIPKCLWNSTNSLGVLMLHNNNFSGIIPDVFSNATKLEALDVSQNHLGGILPKSLINCKRLEFLNVESNGIKDMFPFWLSSLPSLNIVILRANRFLGPLYHRNESIGFQTLRVIDISRNDFSGTLPPFYFTSWRNMTTLTGNYDDMYMQNSRNYVGIFRNTMEMVHKGVDTDFERIRRDFRAIDFSRNKLYGIIPESISLLKELRVLNLSGNSFTSDIPQSLANLTNLEVLDLSHNNLSGRIPQDLGALSFLSFMDFSNNNLEGLIPRGTQFQRQKCSSFTDNPKLSGLEEICGKSHVSSPPPQQPEKLLESEEEVFNWIAAAIGYGPGVVCGLVIGHIFGPHIHEVLMKLFRRKKPKPRIFTRSAR